MVSGTIGLAGVAGAAAGVALLRRNRPYLPAGHAIARDADPLPPVLARGLAGLTVQVRPGPDDELFIGPGEPVPGRTLSRLVLAPLLARARAHGGRLCRDQQVPFRLVVEFAGPDRDAALLLRAFHLLDRQLREAAPLLSRCLDGHLEPGAVTVAITGIVDVRELLATQRERYAFVDGTFDDLGSATAPPMLVPMISEPWARRFGWDGRDEIPAEERHLLHALIRSAHSDGRTVRLVGLPAGPRRIRRAIWGEVLAAGADAVADLDQRGLARFLRQRPPAVVVAARRPVGQSLPGPRAEPV
jgi:hypothetical protein